MKRKYLTCEVLCSKTIYINSKLGHLELRSPQIPRTLLVLGKMADESNLLFVDFLVFNSRYPIQRQLFQFAAGLVNTGLTHYI